MLKTVFDTVSKLDRDDISRLSDKVSKTVANLDSSVAAKAVSILPVTGVSADILANAARTTGRRSRRLARSTGRYVAAHPKQTGLGAGAVVAIGIGAFALYKLIEKKKLESELHTDTKLLESPETIAAE